MVLCNTLVAYKGHIGPDRIDNNTVVVILVLYDTEVVHEGHVGPEETLPYNQKFVENWSQIGFVQHIGCM